MTDNDLSVFAKRTTDYLQERKHGSIPRKLRMLRTTKMKV